MTVGYVVSRFPHVSETFIVRELDAVEAAGVDVPIVLALFPPTDPTVHRAAERWLPRVHRPVARAVARGVAWAALRRPLALAGALGSVVTGYRRRPALLARALLTVAVACAHARALTTSPVDRLHAHYATYPALTAWLIRRLTGIPYGFTAHAHDIYVDRSHLAQRIAEADLVVAISEFNRELLRREAPQAGTTVEVVHCGVEPDSYDFRARAPASDGAVRALCVASLQEYKGHRHLLEALAQPGLERIELDLVGAGPLRRSLEMRAEALRLSHRVHFHGGLEEGAVAELLSTVDLFVLPSVIAADGQMEGIPVALMEAMASGVPVVATRLSGIPELVRDGETGLLVEPADAGALAGALRELCADPGAALRRAAAARALVERSFAIAETGARMATLLAGLPPVDQRRS